MSLSKLIKHSTYPISCTLRVQFEAVSECVSNSCSEIPHFFTFLYFGTPFEIEVGTELFLVLKCLQTHLGSIKVKWKMY